jgi:iron complex transport system substrate-binding protein
MVTLAGGDDVLGEAAHPSFVVEWDAVLATEPEVIIVMPCGFDIPRTRSEITVLTSRPGWETLGAVRSKAVFLTNASAYFSRPGPRVVDGLEILASILHPERFSSHLGEDAFARA